MSKKSCFALLVFSFINLSYLQAEVWKCNGVYTSKKLEKQNCLEVQGSKTCGNNGNKFFSPEKMSGNSEQPCKVTNIHTSPFVDLKNTASAEKYEDSVSQSKSKQKKFDEAVNNKSSNLKDTYTDDLDQDIKSLDGQQKMINDTFGKLVKSFE